MHLHTKHIKKHAYKVSLNDEQQALLNAICSATGEQPSAYIRELAMEQLRQLVTPESHSNNSETNRRAAI